VPFSYRFYRRFWEGIDWLFPPECAGCGKFGERLCEMCRQQVEALLPPVCSICGLPLRGEGDICPDCVAGKPYEALRSAAWYNGVLRQSVINLKYKRDLGLGDTLAELLLEVVRQHEWSVDGVVAVPLGRRRLRERGYNQAAMLAYPLALALGVPYGRGVLSRPRETESQVHLSAEERRQNLAGAFQADGRRAAGKSWLVVDDVTTTGATMENCALALKAAGAQRVMGLTVARAGKFLQTADNT